MELSRYAVLSSYQTARTPYKESRKFPRKNRRWLNMACQQEEEDMSV